MKKIFIAFLFVALVVVAMIPIGQLLYSEEDSAELFIARSELNGLSLNEVFNENKETLSIYQINYNADFENGSVSWGTTNAIINDVTDGILSFTATSSNGGITQIVPESWYEGAEDVYTNIRIKTNRLNVINSRFSGVDSSKNTIFNNYQVLSVIGTISGSDIFSVNDSGSSNWTITLIDYCYLFDVSNMVDDDIFSPIFNSTFDLLTLPQIKQQLDVWVDDGIYELNPWITYSRLGLNSLNKAQMLYWYDYYIQLTA